MFDPNEPKTLPEQVKELLLVLLIQLIVCGIVNAVGSRLAAAYPQPLPSGLIMFAAFTTTGAFLMMDAWSVAACALILRDGRHPEIRPLAKAVLPLTALTGCLLLLLFFFGSGTLNAAAAGCSLIAMLAVMVFPARRPDKKGKE